MKVRIVDANICKHCTDAFGERDCDPQECKLLQGLYAESDLTAADLFEYAEIKKCLAGKVCSVCGALLPFKVRNGAIEYWDSRYCLRCGRRFADENEEAILRNV